MINFDLTDEQRDIQKAVMEFAQGEFDPDLGLKRDQGGLFRESAWKKAAHDDPCSDHSETRTEATMTEVAAHDLFRRR